MKWGEEKCLNLIEIYKSKPLLWDPKDSNYYKKHLKEETWAEIGAAMQTTGADCRQKMVNLLASFRRERMKRRQSMKAGRGNDKLYESKWFAYNALEFLKGRDQPRKELSAENTEDSDISQTVEEDSVAIPAVHEPATKKVKTDPNLQMLKEAFGILQASANRHPSPLSANDNPELRSFSDFILAKMKTYSLRTKNAVQREIFQIIFRADEGFYDDPRPSSASTSIPTGATDK
ncbi:uncharacterized protein [Anabrus simplex]|uniref:uncharacterized protein n=1 Tax=Anabrus simplex TaxID=316456 RepID=UPI0035A2BF69